ncbi:MAG: hypothetical protein AAGA80_17405, partial [Cyanobacteria bacterium P01_F01_bin.143]
MKKQYLTKILAGFLILWISLVNMPQAQAVTPKSNKLLGYPETSISLKALQKKCFYHNGNYGVQMCKQLVSYTPNDPEAWNNLGYKYFHVENYK